jgi:hypothetical protein
MRAMIMLISNVFGRHAPIGAENSWRLRRIAFSRWRRRLAGKRGNLPGRQETGCSTVNLGHDEAVFAEFRLRQLHF